ncbi:MAG: HipA domain-containing protein [Burkholderiales bacterium]|nr:HipA domain-containing protein [Burkholderiales bacterium]OJX09027.1 MAG: phosphatidylinositol kinase [Burkholderiales bacterium 70-64]
MPLHLVGETIDKTRSHYLAETGKLVQLMRGIYVDAGDDVERTVLIHAVRIARYLYSRTYLSAASAVLLGPTLDGRLFLSGQRTQRTRIRGLEIIQNKAPAHPSVASAVVADSLGEFPVPVSTLRQRFLEAFRLRSEHAGSIDAAMREAIAARLIEEYGDPKAASDAVWALARENEWYREGEGAERFLLRRPAAVTVRNGAAFDLLVAWHGLPVGTLSHDGFEWRWTASAGGPPLPPVVRQTVPGKLPPFIVSLLPEGWLASVLEDHRDERALLRSGKRYMSNITIAASADELRALPADLLGTRLATFAQEGLFTGTYAGPRRSAIEQDFEHRLAALYASADTPRLSGVQIKAPMTLAADGTLLPSVNLPFTHILKPAGTSGFEGLPVIEWIGLSLARAAGLAVPEAALVRMPDEMSPALLVERFDIRDRADDTRLLAMEDMCSVLDLEPHDKYSGTIERVARATRALSTAPDDDLSILLRRVLFAWLIADGDMHLKNMAFLKTAQAGETVFSAVRFAPVYDAFTTRVFPGLGHDRMALKLGGKDEHLRRDDFLALAALAGLRAADANATIDEVLHRLAVALDAVALPQRLEAGTAVRGFVARTLDLCRARVAGFA